MPDQQPADYADCFSLADQLRLLSDATDHLLDHHSCDCHGYEVWSQASRTARTRGMDEISALFRTVTELEAKLTRLLIIGEYGYDTSMMRGRMNESNFLSDEWLENWFGKDWCENYVRKELDKVKL